MNNIEYELREFTFSSEEYEKIVDLFRSEGDNLHYDKKFLEWQYEKNPLGKAVGFNAFYGEKLVAHYATIPVEFMVSGVLKKGLLSINTRTDGLHQGKGLFTKLAEETFALGSKKGFNFVIGVANDNSVYGFTKKLSFQHVCKLETRFLINFKEKSGVSPSFYRVWSSEAIEWRVNNPSKRYFHASSGGKILLFGKSRKFNALIGNCSDIEVPQICKRMPWQINPFKLWVGVDSSIDWDSTINFFIPHKFKSVTLNLIFRDLTGSALLDPESLKFWAMDFDAY